MLLKRLAISFLALSCFPLKALEATTQEINFAQCVQKLQLQAEKLGVSDKTRTEVLAQVKFLPKIIEYDRNQPEFMQTFPNYLNKRVNNWRIQQGKKLLKKHQTLLKELTREYGVPAHYLVAFWGLETNYGAYKGKMPVIDSLATLACDQRRSEFFSQELLTALLLMDKEGLSKEQMLGSWAGAMGHTQFMPSAYIKYAVDGDKNGTADLWNSEQDALTSAANFLQHLGWQQGYRWGREVLLPEDFDYLKAGREQSLSLSQWQALGLKKADGSALGSAELQASLLVPAGHKGPAFLVYKNFNVIMGWNNSESYAIAVGYLAERIIGKPALTKALPKQADFPLARIKLLQQQLNELGFDVGEADGIYGPATRKGIRLFQRHMSVIADGYPSEEVWELLEQQLKV